jgi:hypothetical protein
VTYARRFFLQYRQGSGRGGASMPRRLAPCTEDPSHDGRRRSVKGGPFRAAVFPSPPVAHRPGHVRLLAPALIAPVLGRAPGGGTDHRVRHPCRHARRGPDRFRHPERPHSGLFADRSSLADRSDGLRGRFTPEAALDRLSAEPIDIHRRGDKAFVLKARKGGIPAASLDFVDPVEAHRRGAQPTGGARRDRVV